MSAAPALRAVPRPAPPVADPARARLEVLLDLHRRGLREPLPISCLAAAAYVERGDGAARKEWESGWNFPREDAELEHQLAFGGVLGFDALIQDGRFGRLAHELWAPMLAGEELADG